MPTEDNVARIARATGFPTSFFEEDDIELLNADGVSFRSMSKMTAKQRNAAIAAGSIAFVLNDWVDQKFDLVAPDVPDYRGASPEAAAQSLRQAWGLGVQPIKNMIHLLESRGIRVFSLAENCLEVDAYSVWRGLRPFIFFNMGKSGERRRFDAAHELAHLVLHRHGSPNGVEAEKEAHAFAAEFLMPAASIKALGRVIPTLDYILQLKKRWIVSAAAMTLRLHETGHLTYYHYNRLFVELSRKGFRTIEPFAVRPETSQVWQKVFAELRKEGHNVQFIADELSLPADEIAKLVFGLVTIGLPASGHPSTQRHSGPHLRLVK